MYSRDYLLRHIEQLGALLAELRRRIFGGDAPAEVADDLEKAAGQMGLELDLLRRLTLDTLHMFAAPTGEVEPARCWLMAEVLLVDALSSKETGDADAARDGLLKSRALFELVRPAGGMLVGLPEADERIREIDGYLEELA